MTKRSAAAGVVVVSALWGTPATAQSTDPCAPLPPPAGPIVDAGPAQAAALPDIVAAAASGTTIRLADGVYALGGGSLWFRTADVTLRSASGNAAAVVLDNAYQGGSLIEIAASNVTIADLTLQRAYDHPIHVAPLGAPVVGTLVHNVRVIDPGQQGIKINANGSLYADAGVVRCSLVRLTDAGRPSIRNDCYTGGIDGHRARDWHVHDNTIEGFWCETGLSEHAVHFWTGSRDTVVERNTIRNCARGIGFGLGQGTEGRSYPDVPCPGVTNAGHFRGVIRNNSVAVNDPRVFSQAAGGFDAGIGLEEACGVEVVHNSVFSTLPPFSSIEWRFPVTSGRVANNLVSHNLRARDGAAVTLAGNLADAPANLVVDLAGAGDLHLRPDAAAAIDQGTPLPAGVADDDIDREPRDVAPDVGADEQRTTFVDVPRSHWAWRFVESIHAAGLTGGCGVNPPRFCPDSEVTRAQDAAFLLRAHLGTAYVPPPAVGRFLDVPTSSPFAAWVEDLARRGVTGGCSAAPPLYCPDAAVTRAQMAAFLLRTLEGAAYQPPAAAGLFEDLPAADPFASWAEELARRGITAGCSSNPPRYCPSAAVSRAQMAVFLAVTFELTLPDS